MKAVAGSWARYRAILFAILCFAASLTNAQTGGTGAIAGKITDSSGAVVPGVQIQITNIATGLTRNTTTNSYGDYIEALLPPGQYSLHATAAGFDVVTMSGIRVVVTETAAVNVQLKLGTVTTQVTVSGGAELVQSTSAALGRVTSGETVVALPLANRNFTQILALSPGTSVELANAGAMGLNTQNVSANGNRPNYNSFQMNGIEAINITQNSASGSGAYVGLAIPAPDTIAEFKVQTGTYDASYGRSAGATVDFISKSGTNAFHGTAWEFFRNQVLNANDFFLNSEHQPRPDLKQNQFGFVFGGPIRKDKAFFFLSYEGARQVNGVTPSLSLVSTFLPPLTSDRSAAALSAIYGGQSGAHGGVAVAKDGSNINPVALQILNLKFSSGGYVIPSPQEILPSGVGESTFSYPGHFSEDQMTANIDYLLSSKNTLSARYFYSTHVQNTAFDSAGTGATIPGWGLSLSGLNHVLVLTDTHQFSSNLVNEFKAGFLRFQGVSQDAEPFTKADIGMTASNTNPNLATIALTGLFTLGPEFTPYSPSTANTFIEKDTLSYNRGKHTIRVGAEVRRYQVDINIPFVSRGWLSFLSFPDFLLGMSAAENGSSVSNLYTVRASNGLFAVNQRYLDVASFVQDDIRLTSRFTLNAGLRYEYFSPPTEISGRFANFDRTIASQEPSPNGTNSGVVVPSNFEGPIPDGVVRSSETGLWKKTYLNFSPRLGFAWRLLDKSALVLRSGYGIYYQGLSGQPASQTALSLPFVDQIQNSGAAAAAATFQVPFNPSVPPLSAFPDFILRYPNSALTTPSFSDDLKNAYVQQYSFGVQSALTRDLVLELGYVGSKSTNLPWLPRFNQAVIATPDNPVHGVTTTTVQNVASRTPWLGMSPSTIGIDTDLNANYNSLQSSLTEQFGHGLQFLVSYTWSKSLDYSQGIAAYGVELNTESGNPDDIKTNRGPSAFDRTNRFVLSFVYQPPDLRSGPAIGKRVLSKWEFSGVLTLESGLPFSVTDSRGSSVYGIAASFAECLGGVDPKKSGSTEGRLDQYFNTAAFAPAPQLFNGTGYGNCGRNMLRGPYQRNMDLSLQKDIPIMEHSNLQFRAEFFNLTNTPNFGVPASDVSTPGTFGVISATSSNPRVIQFALKYNF